MSKNEQSADLPRHAQHHPGAEVTMRAGGEGDVTVSFSDGSDDLHVSRREFMRISGVAAATAAMAGAACRNDVEHIVPYVDRPEAVRIGMAQQYASICDGCAAQCGVLVTTRAGRPTKLEGNPDHPISQGALCARGQSSYMRLYDPDRQRGPLRPEPNNQHKELDWETLDNEVASKLSAIAANKSGGVAILTSTLTGSAQLGLIQEILDALPGSKHYAYEPLSSEAVSAASQISFGQRHIPHYRFDRADLIVSLGSDFLGTWLSPVEFTKQFSSRRSPESGDMNKLVAFEGNLTLTGANADERHRVRYSHLPAIALALAHVVENKLSRGVLGAKPMITSALAAFTPEAVAERTGVDAGALEELGAALANKKGKSLVVAGGAASSTEQGIQLETAVNLLNGLLDNDGKTLERARPSKQAAGQFGDLQALVDDINSGRVDVLIIDRSNPVYAAPPALGVAQALEKVPFVVSTSDRVDETSVHADYLATGSNALECWGDSNPYHGVYAIRQPVILPLYNTRAFEESLLVWFGQSDIVPGFKDALKTPDEPAGNTPGAHHEWDPGAWYRYLRAHWRDTLYAAAKPMSDFDAFWRDALRSGAWKAPGSDQPEPRINVQRTVAELPRELPAAANAAPGDLNAKELHTYPTIGLHDGRHANNGHLQELPDPVTKHVWGTYIQVSPATFKAAGFELGDLVDVEVNNGADTRVLRAPVLMQPGMHDDVVAMPLGYGRTRAGIIGDEVGVNAFEFSRVADARQILSGHTAALKPTGDNEPLAVVQGAQVIDLYQREVMASTTLPEFEEDPEAGIHKHPAHEAMWEQHDYSVKWGMSIDLTKCTGCSACVTACQEENNISVVGRQGIMEGREMHWMRVDRYYKLPGGLKERKSLTSDPMYAENPYVAFSEHMENPRVVVQPMMCQHCENAPCETVCPVLATTHSADGLNQMTYNRCVGTRYCANNCPFKVRRFNWYNYSEDRSDSFLARIFPEMKEHAALNVAEPMPMGLNPEVTVRSRGVMEKCTFCVQRIRRAKWQMREEGRSTFRDGDVVTACQQSCPADAIEFGNLVDSEHEVTKQHRSKRALSPLGALHVESSVAYLTSVWNTEPTEKPKPGGGH